MQVLNRVFAKIKQFLCNNSFLISIEFSIGSYKALSCVAYKGFDKKIEKGIINESRLEGNNK